MNKRKKITLLFCLIIFALSLIYRLMNPFEQERVEKLTYTGEQVVAKKENRQNSFSEQGLMIALLQNPPKQSAGLFKNIFYDRKELQKPVEILEEKKPEPLKSETEESPAVKPESLSERVQREMKEFESLGFYENQGQTALFLKREQQILVVRKGDRIDGKYLVERIKKNVISVKAEGVSYPIYIYLTEAK